MSVKAFYNFDGVGQGVQGVSGDALLAPLNGAGITGTRNQALAINLYTPGATNINAVGVSGLDAHKVGAGADRRNTLVIYRNPGHPSISAGARAMLLQNFDAKTSRSWRSITGFTWVDFTDREPALGYGMVFAWRNTSRVVLITRRNDGQLQVGNVLIPMERNREYYIEVELFYDAPEKPASSNAISGRVWIDKEVVYTWDKALGALNLSSATVGVEVGYADHSSNSFQMWMGVADIYNVDHEGEAPFNQPLGPQIVKLKKLAEAEAPAWPLVGAATVVDALSDNSDATYIQSPLEEASADLLFDLDLNVGSVVNGIQVLGRGVRAAGAARPVRGTFEVGAAELPTTTANFGVTPSERVIAQLMPSQTEEMAVLQGTALSNLLVRIDV